MGELTSKLTFTYVGSNSDSIERDNATVSQSYKQIV